MRSLICLVFVLLAVGLSHGKRPRIPIDIFYVEPTVGQPWPKPQTMQISQQQIAIHPEAFHFFVNSTSQTCDLLTSALDRYYRLTFFPQDYLDSILEPEVERKVKKTKLKKTLDEIRDAPLLKRLNVHIQQPCDQYPSLESDESCKLLILRSLNIV